MWWIIAVHIFLLTASVFLCASQINRILVISITEFLLNFRFFFFEFYRERRVLRPLIACLVNIFLLFMILVKGTSFTKLLLNSMKMPTFHLITRFL